MNTGAQLTILILVGATTLGCASLGEERARVRSIAAGRVQARELLCTQADFDDRPRRRRRRRARMDRGLQFQGDPRPMLARKVRSGGRAYLARGALRLIFVGRVAPRATS